MENQNPISNQNERIVYKPASDEDIESDYWRARKLLRVAPDAELLTALTDLVARLRGAEIESREAHKQIRIITKQSNNQVPVAVCQELELKDNAGLDATLAAIRRLKETVVRLGAEALETENEPSAETTITLEQIQADWPRFLQFVLQKDSWLGHVLSTFNPSLLQLEQDHILLVCPDGNTSSWLAMHPFLNALANYSEEFYGLRLIPQYTGEPVQPEAPETIDLDQRLTEIRAQLDAELSRSRAATQEQRRTALLADYCLMLIREKLAAADAAAFSLPQTAPLP